MSAYRTTNLHFGFQHWQVNSELQHNTFIIICKQQEHSHCKTTCQLQRGYWTSSVSILSGESQLHAAKVSDVIVCMRWLQDVYQPGQLVFVFQLLLISSIVRLQYGIKGKGNNRLAANQAKQNFCSTPLWELVWHLDQLTNTLDHQKSDVVVMGAWSNFFLGAKVASILAENFKIENR